MSGESASKCPLCDVMERFCEVLDPEDRGGCRELLAKLEKGEISGREFAKMIYSRYPKEKVIRALEAARDWALKGAKGR